MSVTQHAKTGFWIVKYRKDGTKKQKSFPPAEEQQARDFEQRQFEANKRWVLERRQIRQANTWDPWQNIQPDQHPTLTKAYDHLCADGISLADAVLLYLETVPHVAHTEAIFKNLVFGHTDRDGTHKHGAAEDLADRKVQTLTRIDLEKVRQTLLSEGCSASTINLRVSKLKAALNWCADQDFIEKNPWGKYRNLRARCKSRMGTLEDFNRLYPFLPSWLQWASTTAIALCLRPGIKELFSLPWSAFNWKMGTVAIWMPKVGETKTVYPPASYMAEARERFEQSLTTGQLLVCPGSQGQQITSPSTYFYSWHKACLEAGVSMSIYALRHIAASEMLAAGADLAAVAAQLGHKDITTTGIFYAHAIAGAQKKASQLLHLQEFITPIATNPNTDTSSPKEENPCNESFPP